MGQVKAGLIDERDDFYDDYPKTRWAGSWNVEEGITNTLFMDIQEGESHEILRVEQCVETGVFEIKFPKGSTLDEAASNLLGTNLFKTMDAAGVVANSIAGQVVLSDLPNNDIYRNRKPVDEVAIVHKDRHFPNEPENYAVVVIGEWEVDLMLDDDDQLKVKVKHNDGSDITRLEDGPWSSPKPTVTFTTDDIINEGAIKYK